MGVSLDCPCGEEVHAPTGQLGPEVDLRLQCDVCGRGYVATLTRYRGPE